MRHTPLPGLQHSYVWVLNLLSFFATMIQRHHSAACPARLRTTLAPQSSPTLFTFIKWTSKTLLKCLGGKVNIYCILNVNWIHLSSPLLLHTGQKVESYRDRTDPLRFCSSYWGCLVIPFKPDSLRVWHTRLQGSLSVSENLIRHLAVIWTHSLSIQIFDLSLLESCSAEEMLLWELCPVSCEHSQIATLHILRCWETPALQGRENNI